MVCFVRENSWEENERGKLMVGETNEKGRQYARILILTAFETDYQRTVTKGVEGIRFAECRG